MKGFKKRVSFRKRFVSRKRKHCSTKCRNQYKKTKKYRMRGG